MKTEMRMKVAAAAMAVAGVLGVAVESAAQSANEIFVPLADDPAGAARTVNSPVQVDGVRKVAPKRAPRLGEHSLEVLRELSFPDADIDRLCAAGAVTPETAS